MKGKQSSVTDYFISIFFFALEITGTEDDLRKLTMKQMGRILKSYGMPDKQIQTLKRWDRVHVIRDLSTKAASDGIGDGLERFARGEKMKLSEQKQMYRDRINEIWKRENAALSSENADVRGGDGGDAAPSEAADDSAARAAAQKKKEEAAKEDTDSESDDDDFAATFEEEMMDRSEANQLVAAHARGGDSGDTEREAGLGQLRAAGQLLEPGSSGFGRAAPPQGGAARCVSTSPGA